MRWLAFLVVTVFIAVTDLASAPALAVEPPLVPPGPPPSGPVAPLDPTEQKSECGAGVVLPGSQFRQRPSADAMLDYSGAWRFSRGAGQKVAVIDTGVSRHPRLPALEAGGDYVSSSDGLADCDGHGTLVAGLIAAAPSPDDAFAGVAPEATILSIRQNSDVYSVKGSASGQNDPNAVSPGYGNTRTLALAIARAVDLGATVINLSETACAPVGAGMDDASLGQAVRYAFERNVVVVAAAGNVGSQGLCSAQNDVRDPNLPLADDWGSVRTIASPPWFADYVLTVGAVAPDGKPSDFSLHGPWVSLAAPGEQLTSLSPNGPGLMNAWQDPQRGPVPVNGTSFAAPLVSGVVALVRSRFPDLSAQQVVERIKRTAQTPAEGPNAATGYGVVDPIAALTHDLPPAAQMPSHLTGHAVDRPKARHPVSTRGRDIVLIVVAVCAALATVAVVMIRNVTGQPK
ncbi:type VII secretion-associated serine protease mycosin [Mycobacterium sp. 1465703.0]|uniref:type VII secretion-associated serine protease mycosin n=1 Tax=Mycobacterium sp. 1465703.0 TaxID=1834078 RepID=UPI0007FE2387|nr:type VII secretion-associated serine protease mycosin [Mycobacterium sp. 1465703.0]OBI96312.1 type VII secretion-associated serine protease mycosin [Mycobacterium sp. 1465703.0]